MIKKRRKNKQTNKQTRIDKVEKKNKKNAGLDCAQQISQQDSPSMMHELELTDCHKTQCATFVIRENARRSFPRALTDVKQRQRLL